MIARRALLATGTAAVICQRALATSPPPDFSLTGTREQGSLMVGRAHLPGSTVTVDGKPVSVSPDGWFVFGIGYDRTERIDWSLTAPGGVIEDNWVEPIVRQYDIQSITGLPQEYVEPPSDILERMKRERGAIWTAREVDTAGAGFSEPLEWPFAGRLSGIYGSQRILNGKSMAPHLAVDVAAAEGTPIHAAADGIVSIADDFHLEGGFTLIDHGHGVNTCYLHQSARQVKAGDAVRQGDVIGKVGMTGRATGPHCHWGLNWFQMKLDPSRATKTPVPPAA
jgi:hypothetical protein